MADTRRFIEELYRAWRDEKNAALTYAAAAANETDTRRRDIFLRMAAEEEKHAARWEARLRELGEAPGEYQETDSEVQKRRDLVSRDPVTIASTMAAAEGNADGAYEVLATLAPTEQDRKAFTEAGRAERAHDRVLKDMAAQRRASAQRPGPDPGRERHVRARRLDRAGHLRDQRRPGCRFRRGQRRGGCHPREQLLRAPQRVRLHGRLGPFDGKRGVPRREVRERGARGGAEPRAQGDR